MRHHSSTTLALACSALTLLSSNPAHAENLFLLQLGVFSNQENATKQFNNVDEQHNKLLGGKHYILRKTRPISGGDSSWRVLVGPFESRRDASHTCSTIKDQGTDCFVVETAAINVDEFDGATQIAKDTPVIINEEGETSNNTKQAVSTKDSGNSLLPWNWFSSNDGAKNTAAKSQLADDDSASKKASEEVQTAEASSEGDSNEQSNSNININTRSIYTAEPKFSPAATDDNLIDAIAGLFSSDSNTPVETVQAAAPAEPIEEPLKAVVPEAEIKEVEVAKPEPIEIPTQKTEIEAQIDADLKKAQASLAPTEIIAPAEAPVEAPAEVKVEVPAERTGEVEVAEAIPVPLLDPKNVPVTPAPEAPRLLDIKLPKQEDLTTAKQPISEAVVKSLKPEPATITEIAPQQIAPPALPAIAPPTPQAVTPPTTQIVKPTPRYASPTTPVVQPRRNRYYSQNTDRLLQISIFDNDRDAFACLNQIQSSIAGAGILRTRIIKSTAGKAVVRFGPVNDIQLEADICDVVPTCGTNLRCRILTEQRSNSQAKAPIKRNSNEAKPKDFSPRPSASDVAATAASNAASTSLTSRPVWIQLGTSSSRSDAEDRFESLQKRFPNLIGEHSPTITSPQNPSLSGEIHRLRIGPFDRRSEAQRLCAKLSSQGAGCLILTK